MRDRKIDYGIRIEISDRSFRFATEKFILPEGDAQASYLPYLISANPSEAGLSFDEKNSVPNVSFDIWDGYRAVYDYLKDQIFEKARVYVLKIEGGEIVSEDRGYIADISMTNSILSVTVRMSEDDSFQDIVNIFRHNSFQYMQAVVPFDIKFESSWIKYPNLPWKVYQIENHQLYLHSDFLFRYDLAASPAEVADRIRATFPAAAMDVYGIDFDNVNPYSTSSEGDTTVGGPDTPVDETVLRPTTLAYTNIDNYYDGTGPLPAFTSYGKLHIGVSTNLPNSYAPGTTIDALTGVSEVVEYAYFGQGYLRNDTGTWQSTPGQWWFSGIPTYATFTVPFPTAYDIRDPLGLGVVARGALRYKHKAGETISFADNANGLGIDVIWMSANGFEPDEDDPEFGAGYVWLGATRKQPIFERDEKVLSRYKITNIYYNVYDEILNDGSTTNLLRMEIHNRPLDPAHTYATFDIPTSRADIPSTIDPDFVPEMYQHEFMVSSMDIWIPNLSNFLYGRFDVESLPFDDFVPYLTNRWSGVRIDQIRDFTELLQTVGRSNNPILDPSEYAQENLNLINNASGKFAVCSGSEIRFNREEAVDRVFERLFFHVPYQFGGFILVEDPTNAGDVNKNQQYLAPKPYKDKVFLNYLTYKYMKNEAQGYENIGYDMSTQARAHFMNSRFRAILDPVPENSNDLGKYFPICYGYLKRVPALHVISKKTLSENAETAGDDTYIYAQHQCDVALPSDIVIEHFEDGDKKNIRTEDQQLDYQRAGVSQHLIRSPFPDYIDGHYRIPQGGTTPVFVGRLISPYHKLQEIRTLDGVPLKGFKLTGGEWDYRLGALDKRYPIRNGLGNQTLYCTFSGYVDATGEITGSVGAVIKHPLDIIRHFVRRYGRYPYSSDMFDNDNIEYIKSMTPKYEASVYITDKIQVFDLINNLCLQFGIYWTLYGGKIKFYLGEIEELDYSKPIIEGLNIIGNVQEKFSNYNEVVSRIVYNFKKNWHKDSYDEVIDINYTNNAYCSNASKAFANKREMSIDGDYVNLYLVAKRVALKYAKYYATRRVTYNIEVRRTIGIQFSPGDVVPLKYSPLNIDYAPVLITTVKDDIDTTKLECVYFPELSA